MPSCVAVLAFAGLTLSAMGWGTAALAQSSPSGLPADIGRLVVFKPDHGLLTFYEDGDRRSLIYARARLRATRGFCRNLSGVIADVSIDDFGANELSAQEAFEKYTTYWRRLPVPRREARFAAVPQGVVFELDLGLKDGEVPCERVLRTILFRAGSRVALVSEEFWNEPPSDPSRLAEQVAERLGR